MVCIIPTDLCYTAKPHFKKYWELKIILVLPYWSVVSRYSCCHAIDPQNFSILQKSVSISFKKKKKKKKKNAFYFFSLPATSMHHFTLTSCIIWWLHITHVWNSKAIFVYVMGLFHWCIVLRVHPCCSVWRDLLPFKGWIIAHGGFTPCFVDAFVWRSELGLFHLLTIVGSGAINMSLQISLFTALLSTILDMDLEFVWLASIVVLVSIF